MMAWSVLQAVCGLYQLTGATSWLATGLPHSSLFPFQTASIGVYPASTVLDPIDPQAPEKLDVVNFSKAELDGQALSLATAMQYGE